eukprot:gnl/TRDRNA2_/TRDRNA2_172497_c1_seq5.p1 gnl/TRDRNA2_/TRDRNA2_172497_c1~~gnl/TRDRNA2_/TRDRNA2_172497_c1_seq5.p1  ORF type:complete len:100 (-),score=16.35 gnl/TRDRNA2_/TRDRNA2_172497_c1_seq5:100-399(-)
MLFKALAHTATQRIREFTEQNVANASWAFACGRKQFRALARSVQQKAGGFNYQNLRMTLWALAPCQHLNGAWKLMDNANHSIPLPLCSGFLFTECEQRG